MSGKLYLLMLFVSSFGFSQNSTTIGNCKTINLSSKRFDGVAFWFFSTNGNTWTSFGFSQAEYDDGLTLSLDQLPELLSLDPFGDVLSDPLNPKDPIVTNHPFTGTLYIKGVIFENVVKDPFAIDGLGSYFYYLKQNTDCEDLNAGVPPNMPLRCHVIAGFTPIYIYDVIPCSPDLVGEPVVTQPTCSYNKDGQVTFTFGRDLITGERLDLNLMQIVNNKVLPPIPMVFPPNDFFDRKATYDGLGSGTYYLHYQTFQDNGLTLTSDNISPQFVITAPPAFSYELEYTDVTCNNGSDGTIVIKILSGVGPCKFYQDGVVVTPEFVMGKYYIKGLKAKEDGYKIKVTGNGCIETAL